MKQVLVENVADELDLERRLREIPSTAQVRGLFFHMIADDLKRRGYTTAARRTLRERRRIHALYPVTELLVAFADAAPFVSPDPREAVRMIFGSGSRYFASTWFGKAFSRFIRPDPISALDWLEAAREHFCNYGRWRLEVVAADHVILHMFDEYIWIDTAHRGGCEGLLAACGVEGEVQPTLDGPFQGRLDIRWKLRN